LPSCHTLLFRSTPVKLKLRQYLRDNINASYTKSLGDDQKVGIPIPLRPQQFLFFRSDSARSGERGPFGSVGGHVTLGAFSTGAGYKCGASDSQGNPLQKLLLTVRLYPREDRASTGVTTRGLAHVTNAAGYAPEPLNLLEVGCCWVPGFASMKPRTARQDCGVLVGSGNPRRPPHLRNQQSLPARCMPNHKNLKNISCLSFSDLRPRSKAPCLPPSANFAPGTVP
jgi:hypothetical protein